MNDYSWTKRPQDTIRPKINMTNYVRTLVKQGYAESTLVFSMRADSGISASFTSTPKGTFTFEISGGTIGRVYNIAAEVSAPSGDSRVESATVRVRDEGVVVIPGDPNTYVDVDYVDTDYVGADGIAALIAPFVAPGYVTPGYFTP